jgi:hypothetical protein
MVFLALIPALLTIVALLLIMVKGATMSEREEDDLDMHENGEIIRVSVQESKAYWVYDNVLYESEVIREPDFETARPIDVMSLTPKQMSELFEILDDLEKSRNEGE